MFGSTPIATSLSGKPLSVERSTRQGMLRAGVAGSFTPDLLHAFNSCMPGGLLFYEADNVVR